MPFTDTIKIGAGTSITLNSNVMGKVMSFTPAKIGVAKVDINAMDNATQGGLPVEDSIPGWISPGTYNVKMYYGKTQYSTLRGLIGNAGFPCKVIKSDGSGYTFTAYLAELGEEIPLKEAMTCEVTLQINGATITQFNATQT